MVRNSFTILILLVFVFTSCRNDSDEFIPTETILNKEEGNIDLFFEEIAKPLETFTVQVSETDTSHTATGTAIIIPANSLIMQDGSPAEGTISMEVAEYEQKGDIIKLDKSMVENQHMFEPDIAIYINLKTTDGEPLSMAPSTAIRFHFPNIGLSEDASLFFSETTDTDWASADDILIEAKGAGIAFEVEQAGWYTYAFTVAPPTNENFAGNISVKLTDNYQPENTVVYLVLKEYQSIIKMSFDDGINQFSTGFLNNVPAFSPIEIFAVSNRTPTTYFQGSVVDSIEEEEDNFQMDLSERSIQDIKHLIDFL